MTGWRQWVHQPQTVWLRKVLFQVHLWTGLSVGVYICVVCLSGSVLVYRNELYRAFSPTPVIVAGSGAPLSAAALTEAARHAYPDHTVADVRPGDTANHAVEVTLTRGDETTRRLLHPFTGADLGNPLPWGFRSTAWLLDLHDNLLAGESGRRVNGIGAILFLLLGTTGAIIWWPGRAGWRRSMTVDLRANWKRLNWSLHSALGFWFLGFVILWGVTGVYLSLPAVVTNVFDFFEPFDESRPVERVVDRIQVPVGVSPFRATRWPRHTWVWPRVVRLDHESHLGDGRPGATHHVRDGGGHVVESRGPAGASAIDCA